MHQDAAALQLRKDGAVLDDARRLSDLGVENDDVVAMCYKREGAHPIRTVTAPAALLLHCCRIAAALLPHCCRIAAAPAVCCCPGLCARRALSPRDSDHASHPPAPPPQHRLLPTDGTFEPVDITEFNEGGGGGADEAAPMQR